jgi:hypothetical protein
VILRVARLWALAICAVLLALLAFAFTASNTVPSSSVGQVDGGAIGASQLKPAVCTGTVSSIVNVPSGGSLFTVTTANNLILGTTGNDNVVATTGYNCFVGGGPAGSNTDAFTGPATGRDQCIVATSNPGLLITNCTIVGRSP